MNLINITYQTGDRFSYVNILSIVKQSGHLVQLESSIFWSANLKISRSFGWESLRAYINDLEVKF
ncbi:MAG: hypothetical protein F6K17_11355 [Okeania sp. SIO3C4]|nr:hypothetical protein [Okeania sp. SIO3C4]